MVLGRSGITLGGSGPLTGARSVAAARTSPVTLTRPTALTRPAAPAGVSALGCAPAWAGIAHPATARPLAQPTTQPWSRPATLPVNPTLLGAPAVAMTLALPSDQTPAVGGPTLVGLSPGSRARTARFPPATVTQGCPPVLLRPRPPPIPLRLRPPVVPLRPRQPVVVLGSRRPAVPLGARRPRATRDRSPAATRRDPTRFAPMPALHSRLTPIPPCGRQTAALCRLTTTSLPYRLLTVRHLDLPPAPRHAGPLTGRAHHSTTRTRRRLGARRNRRATSALWRRLPLPRRRRRVSCCGGAWCGRSGERLGWLRRRPRLRRHGRAGGS